VLSQHTFLKGLKQTFQQEEKCETASDKVQSCKYLSKTFEEIYRGDNCSEPYSHEVLCKVAVTKEKALEICRKSLLQSKEPVWYKEYSKGLTSSMFRSVKEETKYIP